MIDPICICSTILSLNIVGAYEFTPGMMMIEHLNPTTETTEELIVYTDEYISCWEDGVPIRSAGSADRGRSFTTPNS